MSFIERPYIYFDPDSVAALSTPETPSSPEFPKTDPQIERFLAFLAKQDKAENTMFAYQHDLVQLRRYLKASSDWNNVTLAELREFITGLRGNGYAEATVARKVAAVKSFFHWLTAESVVKEDPTVDLDSPKRVVKRPHSLSITEVEKLLEAPRCRNSPGAIRDAATMRLSYATGMRVSELLGLNVDDIDLASGYVRCQGKGNRERLIPIDRDTAELMGNYLGSTRKLLMRETTHDALFVNHRGERLTRQGLWLNFKGYAKEVGLPENTTTRTLRHSFAVHLLQNKAPLRDVQELLGHTEIAATRVYAKLLEGN